MFRNTIWNLLGEGAPMLAALLSIPLLVAGIGLERFGSLTLIWALLGYLAVLDLGLVRALIQIVAAQQGDEGTPPHAGIVGPALAVIAAIGVVTGGLLALAVGPISDYIIQPTDPLSTEIRHSLFIVAVIAPVALVSAGLRGVLEATRQFAAVNLVRMSVGVLNYLSPLLMLFFSDSLPLVLAAIAVGRALGMLIYAALCVRTVPDLLRPRRYRREPLRPLFSMGLWMMANNLLGPIMTYADRVALASLTPVAMVAFYTTPFEILSRLLFIPMALSAVLFPAAAASFRQNPQGLNRMLDLGAHTVCGLFLLINLAVLLGGSAGLDLWLGPEFAERSAPILTILALGLLCNAVAYAPYALLLGVGRSDVTTRLQLIELPIYMVALWFFVDAWGVLGAAAAWSLRAAGDMLLLLALLPTQAPETRPVAARVAATTAAVGIVYAIGLALPGPVGVATASSALVVGLVLVCWRLLRLDIAGTIARAVRADAGQTDAGQTDAGADKS